MIIKTKMCIRDSPNAKAAWDLMSVAKLVDGKYFLAGTQANSSNVFADIYSAGSSRCV